MSIGLSISNNRRRVPVLVSVPVVVRRVLRAGVGVLVKPVAVLSVSVTDTTGFDTAAVWALYFEGT